MVPSIRTLWALIAAAGLLTAGCAGPREARSMPAPSGHAPVPTSPAPPTTTSTTTTSTTVPATTTAPRAVTVAFGGDVYGQPPVRRLLERGVNPLAAISPVLQRADLAVVNLETAVGHRGVPRDKRFVFQADPALLTALRDSGVDAVSVANNHSFDLGLEGFLETLDHVHAAGLVLFGGGRDAGEAYAPALLTAGGLTVALIGIAVIGPDDNDRAVGDRPGTTNGRDIEATLQAIRAAKELTPIVLVMVHWGAELAACPRPFERDLAAKMVGAGASAVVGAHPHVLQGLVANDGHLIAYSIGNFLFAGRSEATRRTGVLTLTLEPDGTVSGHTWDPARIDDHAQPIPLTGAEREASLGALDVPVAGEACAT